MLRINEVFLNPAGTDSGGEWVEFRAADRPENLAAYRLVDATGKSQNLPRVELAPGAFYVFRPKFSLRNSEERLYLRSGDVLADEASFPGAAAEGESYNRLGQFYFLGVPTPGAENRPRDLALLRNDFPSGSELTAAARSPFPLAFLAALLLSAYAMLILNHGQKDPAHRLSEGN